VSKLSKLVHSGCVFLKGGKGIIKRKVCRMWQEPSIVCRFCHILSTFLLCIPFPVYKN